MVTLDTTPDLTPLDARPVHLWVRVLVITGFALGVYVLFEQLYYKVFGVQAISAAPDWGGEDTSLTGLDIVGPFLPVMWSLIGSVLIAGSVSAVIVGLGCLIDLVDSLIWQRASLEDRDIIYRRRKGTPPQDFERSLEAEERT